jgi:predicted nucleic acid-binding protein
MPIMPKNTLIFLLPMNKCMLDTNILLDYYLDRGERANQVLQLLSALEQAGYSACVTALTLKDSYYIIERYLKSFNDTSAESCKEAARGCIKHAADTFNVLPSGGLEVNTAFQMRAFIDDFEDDLQLACAVKGGASLMISEDKQMQAKSPIKCLSVQEALAFLKML